MVKKKIAKRKRKEKNPRYCDFREKFKKRKMKSYINGSLKH